MVIMAGGQAFQGLISLLKLESRVPRPRVLCEGGNDAAETNRRSKRLTLPQPPESIPETYHEFRRTEGWGGVALLD